MSSDSNSHGKAPPEGIRAAFKEALLRKIERQGAVFPLSYGQRALWFLQESAPESAAYNLVYVARLMGEVEAEELKRLFAELVKRHRQLRTTYRVIDGEPVQETAAECELRIDVIDAGGASEDELVGRIMRQAREATDLGKGPVFRVLVYERSDGEKVLGLIAHHIAVDYWSLVELESQIKEWLRDGKWAPKAEKVVAEVGYEEYVRWQRELMDGEEGKRQWEYWRRELEGELPALNLPTDRARGRRKTFEGEWREEELEAGVAQGLREVGRRGEATLYMVMLGAWEVLLQRYNGQKETLVGTPVAGRVRAEFEKVVGMMVNMVVMRGDGRGDPKYEEYLGDVKRRVLGGLENQDYPFALLVERLKPEREANRSPLCDVCFAWEGRRSSDRAVQQFDQLSQPVLELEPLLMRQMGAPYDITTMVIERDRGLTVCWQFNTDLFDSETIGRMAGHYSNLLKAIINDPDLRISELDLLSESEKRQLTSVWNHPHSPSTQYLCLHQLVERQVRLGPDRVAIFTPRASVSYGELWRRSGRLAGLLQSLGASPEDLVGVCLSRGPDLIVALLGALRSGAAYAPLDPAYPIERLRLMLEDSRAGLLLTERRYAGLFEGWAGNLMCVDKLWEELENELEPELKQEVSGENLAYCLYTSGSTGRPKGVAIEHRSAASLVRWGVESYSPEELSSVLAGTSVCFDLSIFELFVTLSGGGQVVLAENALELWEVGEEGRVSLINTVPSAIKELIEQRRLPEGVKVVNVAGEALRGELVGEIYGAGEVERVVNLYGPTEDTTYSTGQEMGRGEDEEPSIGRPLRGRQAWILGEESVLLPVGVVGEIWLSGEGLSRGYYRRGDLTAERFRPNPYGGDGQRMYVTGDLGRYRENGEIEYVGRKDGQVKLRGYRIEMGEVETALRECEGVKEAVVTLRETRGGEKRLVAYVVKKEGEEGGVESWRRTMRRRLPEYMTPGAFVELDTMPLNLNGKIDRRALPDPSNDRAITEVPFIPPRTDLEKEVAQVWRDVLQLNDIGVHDNFFDLGGHSLLLVKVRDRICNDLHKQISMIDLFQYPTISSLADLLSQTQNGAPLLDVSEGRADDRSRSLRNRRAFRGALRAGLEAEQEAAN